MVLLLIRISIDVYIDLEKWEINKCIYSPEASIRNLLLLQLNAVIMCNTRDSPITLSLKFETPWVYMDIG